MIRVCFVFRDPILKGTSIEEIFLGLGDRINNKRSIEVNNFFYNSKLSLLKNIIELRKINADIYHIPGDVHYLTPFLIGFKVINTIQDIGTYKNLNGIKKYLYGLLWIVIPYFLSKIPFDINKKLFVSTRKIHHSNTHTSHHQNQKSLQEDIFHFLLFF